MDKEKDLTLKKAAKMLLQKGYRVLGWESNHPHRGREYDFASIDFGKEYGRIGSIGFNNLEGFTYGLNYIPSRENGSGCRMFESGTVTMEEIERLMNEPCWVKSATFYISFDDFARKELKLFNFKHEVTLDELKDIEI